MKPHGVLAAHLSSQRLAIPIRKEVLKTLSQAIADAGKDPELQAKLRVQGIEPRDIRVEAFDAHIRNDMARIAPLLKSIAENR